MQNDEQERRSFEQEQEHEPISNSRDDTLDPEKCSPTTSQSISHANEAEINEAIHSPLWSTPNDFNLIKRDTARSQTGSLLQRVSNLISPSHGHTVPSPDATLINDETIVWVEWTSPKDPENPFNWSKRRKWTITLITSFFTFLVALVGSSWPIGLSSFSQDIPSSSKELTLFTISIYPLGFGIAPLILAPFSEAYG